MSTPIYQNLWVRLPREKFGCFEKFNKIYKKIAFTEVFQANLEINKWKFCFNTYKALEQIRTKISPNLTTPWSNIFLNTYLQNFGTFLVAPPESPKFTTNWIVISFLIRQNLSQLLYVLILICNDYSNYKIRQIYKKRYIHRLSATL